MSLKQFSYFGRGSMYLRRTAPDGESPIFHSKEGKSIKSVRKQRDEENIYT
jgi:hypothetical protein